MHHQTRQVGLNKFYSASEKDWKQVFTKDIQSKVKESKKEYKQYKGTGYIIYLQQASNKLFSAVENYLMLKYNRRVETSKALSMLIGKDKPDQRLFRDARQIHKFYYNGRLAMSEEDAVGYYHQIYSELKSRLNKNLGSTAK